MYVLDCFLPSPLSIQSFISAIKILALVKNMSTGHVRANADKNKHVTVKDCVQLQA